MIFRNRHFFLAILLIGFLSNCQNYDSNQNATTENKLESKLGPNNHFFSMRAYPDQDFDFKAYKKSLTLVSEEENHSVSNRISIKGFEEDWETQGPGNIGARVNNLAIDPNDKNTMYAGFSHGGVFKTTDGGANWKPIFDKEAFLSIGHIEVDPNDSKTVYVGTGDVNIPGGFFVGNGIYKSIDSGETWENIGLENHGIISKILVDPTNSQIVYAGAMGHPSVPGNDRGLYKSIDGGTTWEQVLFVQEETGIIDFLINPADPNIIIASGWERFRSDFESKVSGENGGIWKTENGGSDWTQLAGGLPENQTIGRIGLDMSGSNPDVIFSIYISEDNDLMAIYKSEDAGNNWTQLIDYERFRDEYQGNPLGGFGWYFGKIRVNPANDDELFLLGVDLWKTTDSGQTWERATPRWWEYSVHADKHDLDFLPPENAGDPLGIILSTDGGIYKFDPETEEWTDIENIAGTQFYRVAYNPHKPDLYYGGAQDNGTTGGNNLNINDWERLWGGDGFQPVFHPTDSNVFYFETQNGSLTGTMDGGVEFFPADQGLQGEIRNWDMPYLMSPHDPNVLYTGAQSLFRSGAGVEPFFEPMTDSLVSGNSRYFTVSAIDESPIVAGQVYVGTTDGNVWRTQFNGVNSDAVNISAGLPDRYVTSIKASPTLTNTVFVTHSGYKYNEYLPRVHRSDDGGSNWTDISSNLPDLGINDIYILPEHGDSILFVGTDGGIYGTIDGGEEWHRLGTNMPIIPVLDMDWNVAKNELIAGTYARSIMTYNLDKITEPTSSTSPDLVASAKKQSLKIFPNPATDFINFEFLNTEPGRKAEIVIVDASGKLVFNESESTIGKIERQIDISNFPKGNYFLKVKVRHLVRTGSFIVN